MEFQIADLWELVADTVPDAPAVFDGAVTATFAELDETATRCGHALRALGVGVGDRVAVHLHNRIEYLVVMLAAFKIRAVPVNVNYRYKADELRHLYRDAEPTVVVHDARFDDVVATLAHELTGIRAWVRVTDADSETTASETTGTGTETSAGVARPAGAASHDWHALLDAASSERTFEARSGDDLYLLYTGGTTGLPKGVMWRHEDLFFGALAGGANGTTPVTTPTELADRCHDNRMRVVLACPLMHGTAHWMAFTTLLVGGSVVIAPTTHFDADELLCLIEQRAASHVIIVGDAYALPLADALDRRPDIELDALRVVLSGGAVLSPAVKALLVDCLPGVIVVDGYGASETGGQGQSVFVPGAEVAPTTFTIGDDTEVLGDDLRPAPIGIVGRVARRGHIPFGYFRDPQKSASTFPVIDGVRWAVPGDHARREVDGRITLLGRGATSINTGGEKVYPDEIEALLKAHPAVYDAVVIGAPDARWGERVVAVVQCRPGATVDLAELQVHVRTHLADYKVPRDLVVVDAVRRLASGKPDLRWARALLQPTPVGAS